MFEQLMQLPLFQGVSAHQLSAIVEKMPFHFLKFHDGESIIDEGTTCTHLRFVVSGEVRTCMRFNNLQVSIEQTLSAPNVLGPEYLFGLDTSYPFSAIAKGDCGILQLRKSDYVTILQSDKVFLFNILNYLSRNNQRFKSSLLDVKQGTVIERIALLVGAFTTQSSTDVLIQSRQKDLCVLMGTQRATLVRALDILQDADIIDYSASQIAILNLAGLRKKNFLDGFS